jgi:hypothetical protein
MQIDGPMLLLLYRPPYRRTVVKSEKPLLIRRHTPAQTTTVGMRLLVNSQISKQSVLPLVTLKPYSFSVTF